MLPYLFPFIFIPIFISLLASFSLPSFLFDCFLHLSLITSFADFICEVPVAVCRLGKALAASEALVRLMLEVQEHVVHPIAHFCELVTALLTNQHLILPPRPVVQNKSFFEQLLGLPKPKVANSLVLFASRLLANCRSSPNLVDLLLQVGESCRLSPFHALGILR